MRELQQILPQRTQREADRIFAGHQLAWEFRREREERRAWQRHCQWYREAARAHQAEHERLQQQRHYLKQGLATVARLLFGWRHPHR